MFLQEFCIVLTQPFNQSRVNLETQRQSLTVHCNNIWSFFVDGYSLQTIQPFGKSVRGLYSLVNC